MRYRFGGVHEDKDKHLRYFNHRNIDAILLTMNILSVLTQMVNMVFVKWGWGRGCCGSSSSDTRRKITSVTPVVHLGMEETKEEKHEAKNDAKSSN